MVCKQVRSSHLYLSLSDAAVEALLCGTAGNYVCRGEGVLIGAGSKTAQAYLNVVLLCTRLTRKRLRRRQRTHGRSSGLLSGLR